MWSKIISARAVIIFIPSNFTDCTLMHFECNSSVSLLKMCKIQKVNTKGFGNPHTREQPSKDVLRKRCSENMLQIYQRTPMPKCDFNKNAKQIALLHGCSHVNLLHIFRTPFPKNTSGGLLLHITYWYQRIFHLMNPFLPKFKVTLKQTSLLPQPHKHITYFPR